jgi:hypothetical protein
LKRFDCAWLLVVLLTVFAIAPLTYPGFFEASSGFLPAFNAEHISEAPHWGRAADSVRSEGKLPFLLIWPILQFSGSGVVAVKWGYGLAFILGALGVYAWTRPWIGSKGGVLSAVVYTYLPWHLSTVYVRGVFAEAWLWVLWPFALWTLDRLGERRLLVAAMVGALSLAAMIWIQPGLALLSIPLLAAYAVLVPLRGSLRLAPLFAIIGLSLSLPWYIAQQIPEAHIPFAEQLLVPYQLVHAAPDAGLSFQLGVAAVGLSIIAMALWALRMPEGPEANSTPPNPSNLAAVRGRSLWFWAITLLILILLTLSPSAPLWKLTGLHALLTYPWQVLALASLSLAFLAGSTLRLDSRLTSLPAWAGLVALVVLASYPYLMPSFTQMDPGPEPLALIQQVEANVPSEASPAEIMLLDAEVAPPTAITSTLALTLTWQAVEPVTNDYTVFVHVLAEDERKAGQLDSRPCGGDCPTNTWQPGEIVVDRYEIELFPGGPPGPYRLAMGLYVLDTGDRAIVVGRDDRTVYLNVP